MKLLLMPQFPTWWIWLVTASWLIVGFVLHPAGFIAAIVLSLGQSVYFLWRLRSFTPYAVQIRLAYTALLVVCFVPGMRWLYWMPACGTFALVLFGYCLMARVLSLMPWNRLVPLSLALVNRTLFTPPVIGNAAHGLPEISCLGGVCESEARVANH